jgi:formylglycine-generating enzyme required for sulfatase activity
LVILGEPGAGKSTLLDYLVLVFIGRVEHQLINQMNNPVPLFVRLRDIGAGDSSSLIELLEAPKDLRNVPSGYFERLLRAGKCVVLLDGLDEVLDRDLHDRVVSEIKGLAREYPQNWIVVTCRVAGWHDQLPGFRTYEIQEFEEDDVRRFVGAWYREVLRSQAVNALGPDPKPEAKRAAEERALANAMEQSGGLWDDLRANEGLLRIARTPLILSLITLVYYARQTELPRGRARLYERCLEILLEEWDLEDKRLSMQDSPTLKDKLLVLKTIAFHFLRQGILDMDKGGLESLVEPLLPSLNVTTTTKSLIQNIYQRSGVLVEQAIGSFGFAHRALHDFLAASYISDEELDEMLIGRAGEELWREVILIAVGLVSRQRASALIEALLEQEQDDVSSLVLAGWSLSEDIQVDADLRDEVKQRLLERLDVAETAGSFARLSEVLIIADLDAARGWMKGILQGQDPILRQRVLTLVPELGKDLGSSFVPLLLSLMVDNEDIVVRSQAALALGRMGARLDNDGWNALREARLDDNKDLRRAATWAWCELGRYGELGLVQVPAGEFVMGGEEYGEEGPLHSLFLPTFYIGKHPVTVADWRSFVESSDHKPEIEDSLRGRNDHPVVNITWFEVLKYAQQLGMGPPSEAEWEKAARGEDGRAYPWGDEWLAGRANTSEFWGSYRGILNRVLTPGVRGSTTPVGQFSPDGDSPFGCVDMSGNMWEWTRSLWGGDIRTAVFKYPYDAADGREDLNASRDARRVLRGGSWGNYRGYARCAYRLGLGPDDRADHVGFRVVVSPS